MQGDVGFTTGWDTNILHAVRQLSLCTATTEATGSRACVPQLDSVQAPQEKISHDSQKILHATIKTQQSLVNLNKSINHNCFTNVNSHYIFTVFVYMYQYSSDVYWDSCHQQMILIYHNPNKYL